MYGTNARVLTVLLLLLLLLWCFDEERSRLRSTLYVVIASLS